MYLGLDIGTTATKAALVDDRHALLGSATAAYRLDTPSPGVSECDPGVWIEAVSSVLRQLRASAPRAFAGIVAIGLSGQMHSVVLLDAAARAVRPAIVWNDGRGAAEARALGQTVASVSELTGVLPMASFTAAKLLWLRGNAPAEFARIAHVLWVKDFVRHWLTGEFATDMSDAAGGQLLDEAQRRWAGEVVAAIGLDARALPTLLEGPAVSGNVRPSVAAEFGLPAGIPVAAGGADAATGALGLGCVNANDAFISLGTSANFVEVQAHYVPRAGSLLHAFAHCLPQRWYRMAAMLNGASALAWVAQLCGEPDLAALLARVEQRGGGPSRVLFAPYLRGERTPHNDVDARGAFVGLDAACDAVDVTKAVLEGVAFSLRGGQELLLAGARPADALGLIGGGARSVYWSRIIAAVLGRPLTIFRDADLAAAVGGARLAMVGATGVDAFTMPAWPVEAIVEPDASDVAAYAQRYDLFCRLYPAVASFTAST